MEFLLKLKKNENATYQTILHPYNPQNYINDFAFQKNIVTNTEIKFTTAVIM